MAGVQDAVATPAIIAARPATGPTKSLASGLASCDSFAVVTTAGISRDSRASRQRRAARRADGRFGHMGRPCGPGNMEGRAPSLRHRTDGGFEVPFANQD